MNRQDVTDSAQSRADKPIKREYQVEVKLTTLELFIKKNSGLVEDLRVRLGPLLGPYDETASGVPISNEGLVPLAARLEAMRHDLARTNEMLVMILDNLEI